MTTAARNRTHACVRETLNPPPGLDRGEAPLAISLRPEGARAAGGAALSPVPAFVTADARTLELLRQARHVAESHLPVLILGESGTGKELLASGVHHLSPRASGPLVCVNCGALPPSLEEAELFGARRGAFTGAVRDRKGLIEEAEGGTLFLDEVGEMAPTTQAKLLRFLEQGEIRRLGENRVRRLSVRVVAATNRDLQSATGRNGFREDLFYRLCGAPLRIPPLRERPGDVALLLAHVLQGFRRRYGRDVEVEGDVVPTLTTRPWPGNVRQLRNEVERAAVVASAEERVVSITDFSSGDLYSPRGGFAARVDAFERKLILDALRQAGGNRTKAAGLLGGMKRSTLLGKMRRLGIDPRPIGSEGR